MLIKDIPGVIDTHARKVLLSNTLNPRMQYCHNLPPGSLYALGAFESLSFGHISFKFIQNGLHGRFIIHIYADEIYEYVCYVRICSLEFPDIFIEDLLQF